MTSTYETGGDYRTSKEAGCDGISVNVGSEIAEANDVASTGVGPSGVELAETLDKVASLVRNCTDCPLAGGRTNAVPGEGNPQASVMFIGEGPGFQEDRQGRPFVGPAGKLLDGLLASIGSNRESVFIANMVKCRPPGNRDPAPAEMAACTKYLDRQIELINPKLIVTLGRFAFGRYFPGEGITKASGTLREKDGRKIFPVLHPAAVLRRKDLRPTMIGDFKAIAEILEGGLEDMGGAPAGIEAKTAQPAQLSFIDGSDPAAISETPVEASTANVGFNVEDTPRPEQLTLF